MKSSKVTQLRFVISLFALFAVTVAMRFYALTSKPIHFDESINGWFVMQMETVGFYKYDPTNYHGPLYFYLLQLFERLWGRSLETLRTLPAFFSVLSVMIFTLPILRTRQVSWWMALFVLLSPAFLFFGRSGIHEMVFVFFQLVAALGILRWLEQKDSKALGFFLVGLFGMMALKETFAVTLFSGLVAILSLGGSNIKKYFSLRDIRAAWHSNLTWLTVFLIFVFAQVFTGFFRHPQGLLDFVKAFLPWMKTGVHGIGHDKPMAYWLEVMGEAEPLVLVGVGLSVVGLFSKNLFWRFVSVFSLVQLAIYSLIPYKTVWCVLSLVWGFYFSLAYAMEAFRATKLKAPLLLLLLVGVVGDARSSYVSVYAPVLDFSHPYIYVNTTYQFRDVQEFLYAEAKKNPEVKKGPIQVGMSEQWPLPWVFRGYNIASYQHCDKIILENAILYFCDGDARLLAERTLTEPYWRVPLYVREDRGLSYVYFKKSIFPSVPFQDATLVGGENL